MTPLLSLRLHKKCGPVFSCYSHWHRNWTARGGQRSWIRRKTCRQCCISWREWPRPWRWRLARRWAREWASEARQEIKQKAAFARLSSSFFFFLSWEKTAFLKCFYDPERATPLSGITFPPCYLRSGHVAISLLVCILHEWIRPLYLPVGGWKHMLGIARPRLCQLIVWIDWSFQFFFSFFLSLHLPQVGFYNDPVVS